MKTHKLGYVLLGIGIFIVVFALTADSIGLGKKGIQAAQLLLIQCGVLLSAIGMGIRNLPEFELKITDLINRVNVQIGSISNAYWILLGFFITYIFLFIFPVFFNSARSIDYLTRYIPEITPIGRDLTFATDGIKNWLSGNGFYDVGNLNYPPLYAIVFSPFLLLSYPTTFFVMTAVTLFCLILSSLILPTLINKNGDRAILILFFLTSAFSYGLQFELERGQFNILAFSLAFLAVYIFHHHYQFRHLAYLLFSVAIQIKLYPVVFILMFVKDWRDWRNNFLRFAYLGLFNIGLLFVIGFQGLVDFINTMQILFGSEWDRPYNHSIASFVRGLTTTGLGILQPNTVTKLRDNSLLISSALILCYLICLLIVIGRAYKNKETGINLDLFLVCTIGAMILPSLSIDYKLPLLSPAIALTLSCNSLGNGNTKRTLTAILLVIIAFAYSCTLFSFVHRPALLANCFPLIMIILIAITFLNVFNNRIFYSIENQ